MSATPSPAFALSGRQYQCVILLARGKSDWEIAKILGLGEVAVRAHFEEAMRRCGAATRAQLVVCALLSGQLSFSAIVH